MTKIIVLAGGYSDERDVSLRSGLAVTNALLASGYQAVQLDPSHPQTNYEQSIDQADVVFPVLHGAGGEDGSIQIWLDSRAKRYVGADSASSANCFNKWHYKQILRTAGLLTPQAELVSATDFASSELARHPYVLKPYDGGSSVDTFIVRGQTPTSLQKPNDVFSRHSKMLLEKLIVGTEITVGVLSTDALPVIEIIPPRGGEFDYQNKYNGKTQELCPPLHVTAELQANAQQLALQIHVLLKVRDMSRTDFMISTEGKIYALETNTIPGMTEASLFPKAAAAAGHSMPELTGLLVETALQRPL